MGELGTAGLFRFVSVSGPAASHRLLPWAATASGHDSHWLRLPLAAICNAQPKQQGEVAVATNEEREGPCACSK